MQGVVSSDYMQDGDVSSHSHDKHDTEWKGNPKLSVFQPWDSKQGEEFRMRRAVFRTQHQGMDMFSVVSVMCFLQMITMKKLSLFLIN
jgi:hypothetical protein